MKRVLAFGSFDGIHNGHRAMLREAKSLGNYLIVSVAQDVVIHVLKGHDPKLPLKTRIADLKKERIADEVIVGDEILAHWTAIKKYKPDIVAVGYDQHELKEALQVYFSSRTQEDFENPQKQPTIVILKPYEPDTYKSSILNQ